MKIEEEKQIKPEVLDNMKLLKEDYQHLHIPEEGRRMMNEKIEQAKLDKKRKSLTRRVRFAGGAVAAAMAVIVALPNTNESIAKAMEKIPVIGSIVRVVTFRDYDYNDGNSEAHVSIPNIETDGSNSNNEDAANQINNDVKGYTQQLIDQFEADAKDYYGSEAYKGLDVSYDVITDTEDWFTLRITVLETAASGNQYYRFYHIDKKTNSVATLSTVFKDDVDYITPISENIKEQMRANTNEDKGIVYFLDDEEISDNFKEIKPDQNFYFNSNNDLVIVFDEYEVAPGSMGNPEFVIPNSVISGLLK
nr:RsiV family protein [uncultured Anaerosporobacter sp.]